MAERALRATNNGDATVYTYGKNPNNALTWDGNRIHGCLCDRGWHGFDCSLRDCPGGDDPGTYNQHVEVQLMVCKATDGFFSLTFRQATSERISFNSTAPQVQAILQKVCNRDEY